MDKALVKFKAFPEDFIVEEIGEDYSCNCSSSPDELQQARVDLGRISMTNNGFLICDLEKINLDHFSVFEILSKKLDKHLGEFGYAGTKDKAAWTCQRISIFNPDLEKIKRFSFGGVCLKNFKWSKHKIEIGDLIGNRFKITLRDADKDAIKILKRLRNSDRLPNFFGSQRFGSLRGDNVEIGKLIFKRKFKEAVWMLLTGYGNEEDQEVKEAKKKLVKEKNLQEARSYFPEKLKQELRILDYLSNKPDDWLGALSMVSEKTLLIICQSVQSEIFNDILQKVIDEEFSLHDNKVILPGHNTQFSGGRLGFIEKEVLESNNIRLSDFELKEIPFLTFKGSKRDAFSKVRELTVDTESDEIFTGSKKIMLSFILDSGVYATTFLEQFFELS